MGTPLRLRVGVAGALGRMGRMTCIAVAGAPDMELVAGFARRFAGEPIAQHVEGLGGNGLLFDDLGAFFAQNLDVVVDFTVYPVSRQVAGKAIETGVNAVIGATGWPQPDVISFQDAVAR